MQHKKPFPIQQQRSSAKPPAHDPVTRASGMNFPSVGMTLNSYKHSPFTVAQGQLRTDTKAKTNRNERSFFKSLSLKRVSIFLALSVLIIGGWVGGKFIYNTQKVFGGNILNVLTTTKLKGEEKGRVNILLAGNSADDIGHNGGELTDSIMLISLDTKNNKAYMMSIPRDLWVNIGDDGYNKINYAYVSGKENDFNIPGFPKGGMGQLESVVESNFGVDINYFALVNYTALRDAVNAVGGINYTVNSVDKRGIFDPNIDYTNNKPLVKLPNGTHKIDGQQALNIARARGDSFRAYGFPRSDFDRTENQRQILTALQKKAITAGVLSNPSKLSNLADALGDNVISDIEINEVRRMYELVKGMKDSDITSVGLNSANGKNLLDGYTSPNGQSALIPAAGLDDFSEIQQYLKQITSSNLLVREGAQLVVLNGTTTTGLAGKVRTNLDSKEIKVLATGDATDTVVTQIVDDSEGTKPATIAYLKKLYPKATVTKISPYTSTYTADIILVLGADAVPKPAPTSTE